MPIYEYVAEECRRQPPCSRRKEYLQTLAAAPESACRECGVPIVRVFSRFAARSGTVGVSYPDPTPLNVTGAPPPADFQGAQEGDEGCGAGDGHAH